MPVVEGAWPYEPGSEQMYKKIEKKKTLGYRISNWDWGTPDTYTIYEGKTFYER